MDPKIELVLHLADNALILGHRNSEWTGHGPILEQDIAISNIALDLVGQARNFYQYAAQLLNEGSGTKDHTEDTLAYLRDGGAFRNHNITELPKGDWAVTTLRQFLVSLYQKYYYSELMHLGDKQLQAIAEKSLKEIDYHIKWSGEWVVRLGDGTEESRRRLIVALEELRPYTQEFFHPASFEKDLDLKAIEEQWRQHVIRVFEMATILSEYSDISSVSHYKTTGKDGIHTEHLGYILAEMQYLQRTYPGCEW